MFYFGDFMLQVIQYIFLLGHFQLLPLAVVQLLAIGQHIRNLFYLDEIMRCFYLFVRFRYFMGEQIFDGTFPVYTCRYIDFVKAVFD